MTVHYSKISIVFTDVGAPLTFLNVYFLFITQSVAVNMVNC